MINSISKVVVKIKGNSKVESALSTILYYLLCKYVNNIIIYILNKFLIYYIKILIVKYYIKLEIAINNENFKNLDFIFSKTFV